MFTMKKRLAALALTLVMCLSLLPTAAFADDDPPADPEEPAEEEITIVTTASGKVLQIWNEDGSPNWWNWTDEDWEDIPGYGLVKGVPVGVLTQPEDEDYVESWTPDYGWFTSALAADPNATSFTISTAEEYAGLTELSKGTKPAGLPAGLNLATRLAESTIVFNGMIDMKGATICGQRSTIYARMQGNGNSPCGVFNFVLSDYSVSGYPYPFSAKTTSDLIMSNFTLVSTSQFTPAMVRAITPIRTQVLCGWLTFARDKIQGGMFSNIGMTGDTTIVETSSARLHNCYIKGTNIRPFFGVGQNGLSTHCYLNSSMTNYCYQLGVTRGYESCRLSHYAIYSTTFQMSSAQSPDESSLPVYGRSTLDALIYTNSDTRAVSSALAPSFNEGLMFHNGNSEMNNPRYPFAVIDEYGNCPVDRWGEARIDLGRDKRFEDALLMIYADVDADNNMIFTRNPDGSFTFPQTSDGWRVHSDGSPVPRVRIMNYTQNGNYDYESYDSTYVTVHADRATVTIGTPEGEIFYRLSDWTGDSADDPADLKTSKLVGPDWAITIPRDSSARVEDLKGDGSFRTTGGSNPVIKNYGKAGTDTSLTGLDAKGYTGDLRKESVYTDGENQTTSTSILDESGTPKSVTVTTYEDGEKKTTTITPASATEVAPDGTVTIKPGETVNVTTTDASGKTTTSKLEAPELPTKADGTVDENAAYVPATISNKGVLTATEGTKITPKNADGTDGETVTVPEDQSYTVPANAATEIKKDGDGVSLPAGSTANETVTQPKRQPVQEPVMVQAKDEDGNPLWEDEEQTKPVMVQKTETVKTPKVDPETGEYVRDVDGKIVYEETVQPVTQNKKDINGNVIYEDVVDEDGNPVYEQVPVKSIPLESGGTISPEGDVSAKEISVGNTTVTGNDGQSMPVAKDENGNTVVPDNATAEVKGTEVPSTENNDVTVSSNGNVNVSVPADAAEPTTINVGDTPVTVEPGQTATVNAATGAVSVATPETDESGEPKMQPALNSNGTPKQTPVYNEDGTPKTQDKMVQSTDENGQPVFQEKKDEQGNTVTQPKVDAQGNPVYVQETNEDGTPKTDEQGNPVYKQATNEDGTPKVDDQGNPVYVQETEPVMEPVMEPVLDANGQPVQEPVMKTEMVPVVTPQSYSPDGSGITFALPLNALDYQQSGGGWYVKPADASAVTNATAKGKLQTGDYIFQILTIGNGNSDYTFKTPGQVATVTIPYAGWNENCKLYYQSGGNWTLHPAEKITSTADTVTFETTHFSTWRISDSSKYNILVKAFAVDPAKDLVTSNTYETKSILDLQPGDKFDVKVYADKAHFGAYATVTFDSRYIDLVETEKEVLDSENNPVLDGEGNPTYTHNKIEPSARGIDWKNRTVGNDNIQTWKLADVLDTDDMFYAPSSIENPQKEALLGTFHFVVKEIEEPKTEVEELIPIKVTDGSLMTTQGIGSEVAAELNNEYINIIYPKITGYTLNALDPIDSSKTTGQVFFTDANHPSVELIQQANEKLTTVNNKITYQACPATDVSALDPTDDVTVTYTWTKDGEPENAKLTTTATFDPETNDKKVEFPVDPSNVPAFKDPGTYVVTATITKPGYQPLVLTATYIIKDFNHIVEVTGYGDNAALILAYTNEPATFLLNDESVAPGPDDASKFWSVPQAGYVYHNNAEDANYKKIVDASPNNTPYVYGLVVDMNKLIAAVGAEGFSMEKAEEWVKDNKLSAIDATQDRTVTHTSSFNDDAILDVNGDGNVTLGDACAVKMIAVGGGREDTNVTSSGFTEMLESYNDVALKSDFARGDGSESDDMSKKVTIDVEVGEYLDLY